MVKWHIQIEEVAQANVDDRQLCLERIEPTRSAQKSRQVFQARGDRINRQPGELLHSDRRGIVADRGLRIGCQRQPCESIPSGSKRLGSVQSSETVGVPPAMACRKPAGCTVTGKLSHWPAAAALVRRCRIRPNSSRAVMRPSLGTPSFSVSVTDTDAVPLPLVMPTPMKPRVAVADKPATFTARKSQSALPEWPPRSGR